MTDREKLFDLIQHWRLLITDETYCNGAILDTFNGIVADIEAENVLTRAWRVMHDDESYTDDEVVDEFNDLVAETAKEINNDNQ